MISRLIHTEYIKTAGFIPFRVILLIHLSFFLLGLFALPRADVNIPFISIVPLYQFPHVWNFITFFSGYYNLTLVLLVIMMTCMEFNNRTFKQQIIFGLGRKELFMQKMILIFSLSLYVALLIFLSALFSGIAYSYKLSLGIAMERSWLVLASFLQTFIYLSLGLLFALVFRNVILSVLLFGFYRVFLEPIIRISVNKDYTWYFPTKFVTNLTPKPEIFDIIGQKMGASEAIKSGEAEAFSNIIPKGVPWTQNLMLSLVFLSVLLIVSWYIFQRRRLN